MAHGTLKAYLRVNVEPNNSVQKLLNIIGNDESIVYLENILKAFRNNKINKVILQDNTQILWIMEFFGYGLSLSFDRYETINEIIQIYYNWLSVLKSDTKSPNVPQSIIHDPDLYGQKILDQLYNAFLPRIIDTSTENLGYQAMACIQILLIINSLTETSADSIFNSSFKVLTPELWEHVLLWLLRVNDTILNINQDSMNPEYITLGNLVGNQALKTLFDVWIRSGSHYFPAPIFWNTLKQFCKTSWKFRYLPLIEQWSVCNLYLSRQLLKSQTDSQTSSPMDFDVLAQYWFKMLRTIGSPQHICFHTWLYYCRHQPSNSSTSMSVKDWAKDLQLLFPHFQISNSFLASHTKNDNNNSNLKKDSNYDNFNNVSASNLMSKSNNPLEQTFVWNHLHLCSLIFLRFLTGISKIVDIFLGCDQEPITNSTGTNIHASATVPIRTKSPTPPAKKKNANLAASSKDALPKQISSNLSSNSPSNQSSNQSSNNLIINNPSSQSYQKDKLHNTSSTASNFNRPHTSMPNQTNLNPKADLCYQLNTASPLVISTKRHNYITTIPIGPDNQNPQTDLNHYSGKVGNVAGDFDEPIDRIEKNGEDIREEIKDSNTLCSRDSLLKIFGEWLFSCASLNTGILPFSSEIFFQYGKAEACGTLCRIICQRTTDEPVSPLYLYNFYNLIHFVIDKHAISGNIDQSTHHNANMTSVENLDITQACVLINSPDLFRIDLEGVSVLLRDYLILIDSTILNCNYNNIQLTNSSGQMGNRSSIGSNSAIINYQYISETTISSFALRNSAINILSSVVCLATHNPNLTIEGFTFEPAKRNGSENLDSSLIDRRITFATLRKPVLDLLFGAMENEIYSSNVQMLLGLMSLILLDFALYQGEVNALFDAEERMQTKSTSSSIVHHYNLRSSIPSSLYPSQPTRSHDPHAQNLQDDVGEDISNHGSLNEPNDKMTQESDSQKVESLNHYYWCFDCLFETIMGSVLKTFDKWWIEKEDFNVALSCLATLSQMAKIKILIYKPLCETIIKTLCNHVVRMCSQLPPTKHTKDLHTLIVFAYSCLSMWLTYHPSLLDDQSLLYLLLEISEIGMTGHISRETKDKTVIYKEQRECRPVSKRVANASENLLALILTLNKTISGKTELDDFTLKREIELLTYVYNNNNPKYRPQYFSLGFNLIFGFFCDHRLPTNYEATESVNNQCILVIHNSFGRQAWKLNYAKSLNGTSPRKQSQNFNLTTDPIPHKLNSSDSNSHLAETLKAHNFGEKPFYLYRTIKPEFLDKMISQDIQSYLPPHLCVPADDGLLSSMDSISVSSHYDSVYNEKDVSSNDFDDFEKSFKQHMSEYHGLGKILPENIQAINTFPQKNHLSPFDVFKTLNPENLAYYPPKNIQEINLPRLYLSQLGFLNMDNITKNFDQYNKDTFPASFPQQLYHLNVENSKETLHHFTQSLLNLNSIESKPKEIVFVCYETGNGYDKDRDICELFNQEKQYKDNLKYEKFQKFLSTLGANNISEESLVINSDSYWKIIFVKKLDNHLKATKEEPNSKAKHSAKCILSTYARLSTVHPLYNNDAEQRVQDLCNNKTSPPYSFHGDSMGNLNSSISQQSKIMFFTVWLETFLAIENFPFGELYETFNEQSHSSTTNQTSHNTSTQENKIDIFVIFIHPLKNGLFRIFVKTSLRGRTSLSFPLFSNIVVSNRTLFPLIRETIIHVSQMKKLENERYEKKIIKIVYILFFL
ncbi:unnamed protein product [Gordionus sp. m RMFG-2023]